MFMGHMNIGYICIYARGYLILISYWLYIIFETRIDGGSVEMNGRRWISSGPEVL